MTTSHSEFWRLASHVRACESDEQVVLLDLRRNRYVGISGPHSRLLASHVEGWPTPLIRDGSTPNIEAAARVTAPLVSQGLLTHAMLSIPLGQSVAEATASLDLGLDARTRISAGRVARFMQSAARTALRLQFQTLESIAGAVASRRARLQPRQPPRSLEAVRSAMSAYEWMRPFLMTARENCLHDSLAVVDFLASEGMFPCWVIGIKTRPFAAHSWVQSGEVVVNDLHENVRRYRPILVV